MSDKPRATSRAQKPIAENRRARFEFEVLETLEAGLVLQGSEVKSLRGGKASLAEAYVRLQDGEAWLVDAHIAPYPQANKFNHEPRRLRKLLMSASELRKWAKRVAEKGLTVAPLRMYFLGPWAKVEVALVRGRKLHDKREHLKEKDDRREMARATRGR